MSGQQYARSDGEGPGPGEGRHKPHSRNRENIVFGLVDCAFLPLLMIAVAPVLLRRWGAPLYGAWVLVNSVAATVGSLGGGFGEATVKYVSHYRGRGDSAGVARAVSASLLANGVLGGILSIALCLAATPLCTHLFHIKVDLAATVIAVRISAAILFLRTLEAIFASVQRAYERYGSLVVTGVAFRAATVLMAALLAVAGKGIVPVMATTLMFAVASLCAQAANAVRISGVRPRLLVLDRHAANEILGFGAFSWFKSVTSVMFTYGDRLVVGAMLGTASLAYYSLCSQITQPIVAVVAAGASFVFPALSAARASGALREAAEFYRKAVVVGALAPMGFALIVALLARPFVAWWLGPAAVAIILRPLLVMAVGHALLAASVVPQYAALATGRIREVAFLNAVTGALSLAAGVLLMRHWGLDGAAGVKLLAGALSLLIVRIARDGMAEAEPAMPGGKALAAAEARG